MRVNGPRRELERGASSPVFPGLASLFSFALSLTRSICCLRDHPEGLLAVYYVVDHDGGGSVLTIDPIHKTELLGTVQ